MLKLDQFKGGKMQRKISVFLGDPAGKPIFLRDVFLRGEATVIDVVRRIPEARHHSCEKYHLNLLAVGKIEKGVDEAFQYLLRWSEREAKSLNPASIAIPYGYDAKLYIILGPIPNDP